MKRVSLAVLLALIAAGCTAESRDPGGAANSRVPPIGIVCTENLVASIVVDVRDGFGNPAAYGATAEFRDGDFVYTVRGGSDALDPATAVRITGPYERAGLYTVTVRKPGYRDWVATDVLVQADECHVHTVVLQATLEKAP